MTTNELATRHSSAAPSSPKGFLFSCLLALAAMPSMAQATLLTTEAGDGASVDAVIQPLLMPALSVSTDPMPQAAADVNLMIANQSVLGLGQVKSGRVQALLQRALALLGTPYRWGGTTTDGFDCSGLVGYVFRSALGINLPRVSRDMASQGQSVAREQLAEGDLVFFSRSGRRVDHVGIYVGNGQFVHAPRTGKDVMVSRLDAGYWSGKYMQARRVAI